ncbi:MAG TPA: hypothetical protein DFS52_10140, partial [Myxococcales bacterium]|nr:hypothetical protein [Myxococcales bacterium]
MGWQVPSAQARPPQQGMPGPQAVACWAQQSWPPHSKPSQQSSGWRQITVLQHAPPRQAPSIPAQHSESSAQL